MINLRNINELKIKNKLLIKFGYDIRKSLRYRFIIKLNNFYYFLVCIPKVTLCVKLT